MSKVQLKRIPSTSIISDSFIHQVRSTDSTHKQTDEVAEKNDQDFAQAVPTSTLQSRADHPDENDEDHLLESDFENFQTCSDGMSNGSVVKIHDSFFDLDFSRDYLCENSGVENQNALLSLLVIVASNEGCDELLHDLMKREQLIHQNPSFPTNNSLKTLFPKMSFRHVRKHEVYNNGEIVFFLKLSGQLKKLINRHHHTIVNYNYSLVRKRESDLKLQPFIRGNRMRIRLILNTEGAVVRKSESKSA